jgi:hypothetical protein
MIFGVSSVCGSDACPLTTKSILLRRVARQQRSQKIRDEICSQVLDINQKSVHDFPGGPPWAAKPLLVHQMG